MYTLAEPTGVSFTDDAMSVSLDDGRTITEPLAWFPRLLHATRTQLETVGLNAAGVHRDELDEHVAAEALLAARSDLDAARTSLRAA